MTRLNLSLIAIGAVIALVALFFSQSRSWIDSLYVLWLTFIIIVMLALLTSVEVLEIPANLLLGALVFVLAYEQLALKQLYESGWIVFVFGFLVLVAAFMKRSTYAE